MVNLSLGAPRFPTKEKGVKVTADNLGPGSYPNAAKSIKPPIVIGSPFQSNSVRFKSKIQTTDIAPGSYELNLAFQQKPVKRVWRPFVVTLQSRLNRTMVLLIFHLPTSDCV